MVPLAAASFYLLSGRTSDSKLAILAVQELAHRLPPSRVRLTHGLALVGVHAALSRRECRFRGAALGAAVGKTGFIRLQLKLFSADRANFYGESHLHL
jgi:hypothetical protein